MPRAAKAAVAVEIKGLRELRAALKAIDPKLLREANVALRDAVQPIAADAKTRAPFLSGVLSQSVRAGATGKGAFIGAGAVYAGIQEFGGTIKFATKAGELTIKPQPFLWPAITSGADDVVDRVGDAIDRLAAHEGFR
jgi:HK97 gp10 family phage protein